MKKRGFVRTIESESTTYDLPWGSYNDVGERTMDDVLERAKDAAAATGYKAGVLASEGFRASHGLQREAEAPRARGGTRR